MLGKQEKRILDEVVMPIIAFKEGKAFWANRRARKFLHIRGADGLKEKDPLRYVHEMQPGSKSREEVIEELIDAFSKTDASRHRMILNVRGIRIESEISVVPMESGIFDGFVVFDRMRSREERVLTKNAETFYSGLFENINTAVMICDEMNRVLNINGAFTELFGYDLQESKGRYFYDLIVPAGKVLEAINAAERAFKGGALREDFDNVDKWGRPVFVRVSGYPIFKDGSIVGTYHVYEKREDAGVADKEHAIQQAYFEGVLESTPEALALLDTQDRIVYANKRFERLFGFSGQELRGECINNVVANGELRLEAERISDRAMKADAITIETIRYHRNGTPIPVELVARPIVKEGELLGVYALYRDMTEESRIREALRVQTEYFKQLFDNSSDAIVLMDEKERIMSVNRAFEALFGYTNEESVGKVIAELIVPEICKTESEALRDSVLENQSRKIETVRRDCNGRLVDVEAQGHGIILDGRVKGILANFRDIRARREAREALEEQRAYFKQLFDNSPEALVIIDPRDRIRDVNKGFCDLFGYSREETIGEYINDLIAPADIREEAERLSSRVIGGQVVKTETKRRCKSGKSIDVAILAYPILLKGEKVGGYAIYSDITEKKKAERDIQFLIYKDSLTGLYNRKFFYDALRDRLAKASRETRMAVCYIDLNGFKRINDHLGHAIGDELLRYVSRCMEDSLEPEDIVARMGGDEFVIWTRLEEDDGLTQKIERIIDRFNKSLDIFNHRINISLSIGAALYPEHGCNAEELIKKADLAMYEVKQEKRNGYLIYNNEIGKRNRYNYEVERQLKMALASGEITMHYQPILRMDGGLAGFEALMRWRNTQLGDVPPDVFILMAEDMGIIHELGIFALNRAFQRQKEWGRMGGGDAFMSVNLSVRQMEREGFCDLLQDLLDKHGVDARSIHLEITESISAENLKNRIEVLNRLKQAGFILSMDDFGTGYSSLKQMRSLFIDNLKIDRSFIGGIDSNAANQAIVKAIVAMAESFGFLTIAEGVETEAERKTLEALGCDMYQGYLALPPVEAAEMEAFLKTRAGQ